MAPIAKPKHMSLKQKVWKGLHELILGKPSNIERL
jgi:hypothetical protein